MAFLSFNDGGSGVTNRLKWSEDFSNAAWNKTNGGLGSVPVVTANAAAAPDGTTTADSVVFVAPSAGDQSSITQDGTGTVTVGATYAGSVFVKAATSGDVGKVLLFRQVGRATYTTVTLTAAWQRMRSSEVASLTNNFWEIGLRPDQGGSVGTVTALLWGAQVEDGSYATAYTPTTSATAISASLHNDYPGTPASRFSNWTPSTKPYGDSVNTLASGAVVMFRHRTDYGASFDLVGIPVKAQVDSVNRVAIADRLIAHLMGGGTCLVQTDDSNAAIYKTCGLAPGSSPSLQLTDSRNLLYTLSLSLINLAASPVRMDCVYAP